MTKRSVSVLLILALLVSMIIIPMTFASAAEVDETDTSDNKTVYNLAENTQDGNILHAFNWKAKEITEHAKDIAEAGYSTVQITPMQTTKKTSNAGAFATDWWCFYQPIAIGVGNALGTQDEIKEMCTALHSYGVKVIADVVFNHTMGIVAKSKSESSEIAKQLIPGFYDGKTYSKYYRRTPSNQQTAGADDQSRKNQVQNDLNKELPDLNTANKDYQNDIIKNVLNVYQNLGVDGFRFDAAKHIETPNESDGLSSDFWPTVTNAIKSKNSKAYIYGETLSNGGRFNITQYTKYIHVTDYAYGNTVRSALSSSNASSLTNYGYSGSQKSDNVLWVESHDNFCDYTSTKLTKAKQIVGWAAIAARKEAPALYFVRPKCEDLDSAGYIKYDEYMGYQGAATTWKDPSVVAVNRFKNAFVGKSETCYANGSLFFVQRGNDGMVISNLATGSKSVSQNCSMTNGTYTDQITGNKFTVSGGKITGNIGSSGVAVIYNTTKDIPKITIKLDNQEVTADTLNRYVNATAKIDISTTNCKSMKVKVSNLPEHTYNKSSVSLTLNSGIAYGKSVDITVTATSNTGDTLTQKVNVHKKNANEAKVVYFDNTATNWFYNKNSAAITGTTKIFCVTKSGPGPNQMIKNFPGIQMTLVKDKLYKCTVSNDTKYVKFSEGQIPSDGPHLGHTFTQCGGYCGRTMPQTVIPYGSATNAQNRQNGGYELVGSMICKDLKWYDYGDYPVASLSSSDVTFPDEPTTESTTPTQPSSETKPTETYVPGQLILGDADLNNTVEILDAQAIQKDIANIKSLSSDGKTCANVDGKGVSIVCASLIQKYLANIPTPYDIGKPIQDKPTEPTSEPTTEPTEPSFVKVSVNLNGCFSTAESICMYCEGSSEYPGTPMTQSGSVYTCEIDPNLYSQFRVVGVYDSENTIQSDPLDVKTQTQTLKTYTVSCKKSWSDAYVHIWSLDGSGVGTVWPGVRMSGSYGNHSLVIPECSIYAKYKFNSGLGGSESSEYSFPWYTPENKVLYCDFGYKPTTAYAHIWSTGGSGTVWPGQSMEYVTGNIYKIEVPQEYDNIIFNNGSGDQTSELPIGAIDSGYIYYKNSGQWQPYN